jgi:hypothetical protein
LVMCSQKPSDTSTLKYLYMYKYMYEARCVRVFINAQVHVLTTDVKKYFKNGQEHV